MRNKILYIAFAAMALLITGCAKDQGLQRECGLDVRIDDINGSRLTFTVTPENERACYCYSVFTADQPEYEFSDEELLESELKWREKRFSLFERDEVQSPSFADVFCFRGTRTLTYKNLDRPTLYRLIVFQVDPKKRKALGPLYKLDFRVEATLLDGVQFTIIVDTDSIMISPSDESAPWFWDYELSSRVKENYGTPIQFYYEMVDMYREYGFMENVVKKGYLEWDFSTQGTPLRVGEEYVLVLSGYSDGAISTYPLCAYFIYYGGNGLYFDPKLSEIPILYGR